MIKKMLKKQKGFTLIELLAVIVILGIIAAIAVPAIGGVIDKSRNDAVKAEAMQILNAANIYVSSNNIEVDQLINHSDLSSFLNSVDDTDYAVFYNGGNLYITGHAANPLVSMGTDLDTAGVTALTAFDAATAALLDDLN